MCNFCPSSLKHWDTLQCDSAWKQNDILNHFPPLPFPPINLFFLQILVVWVVLWTLFSPLLTVLHTCLCLPNHGFTSKCIPSLLLCFLWLLSFKQLLLHKHILWPPKKVCADSSSHISLEHWEFRVLLAGRSEHSYSIFSQKKQNWHATYRWDTDNNQGLGLIRPDMTWELRPSLTSFSLFILVSAVVHHGGMVSQSLLCMVDSDWCVWPWAGACQCTPSFAQQHNNKCDKYGIRHATMLLGTVTALCCCAPVNGPGLVGKCWCLLMSFLGCCPSYIWSRTKVWAHQFFWFHWKCCCWA